MDQKGNLAIIAGVVVVIVIIIFLLLPKGRETSTQIPNNLVGLPPPSLSPNPSFFNLYAIKSIDEALEHKDELKKLLLCDLKLTSVSPKVGELTKTEYLDLSEDNLTALPQEIEKLANTLRELVLVGNNFSLQEQARIKKILPYTKIAFSPQKNFDPYFKDSWETYDSKKYGFSFRYHPELLIRETDDGLFIENEFANMNQNAYDSCAVEDAFIRMAVTVQDNLENFSPIDYLKKKWQINPTLKGDEYVFETEMEKNMKMIKDIKVYINGDIEGLIADAGESEHPQIISNHNGKIYIFQYLSGGQTGSRIPPLAKQTLEQTLATFKYAN